MSLWDSLVTLVLVSNHIFQIEKLRHYDVTVGLQAAACYDVTH